MRTVRTIKQTNSTISAEEIDRRMRLGELVVVKQKATRGNSKARDVFTQYAIWRSFPSGTKRILLVQAYIRYKKFIKEGI